MNKNVLTSAYLVFSQFLVDLLLKWNLFFFTVSDFPSALFFAHFPQTLDMREMFNLFRCAFKFVYQAVKKGKTLTAVISVILI